MYDEEHVALFRAIRSGNPINNGKHMAISTMLAVMGRLASCTGQAIAWDEAMNSKRSLAPAACTREAAPPNLPDANGNYPIAKPGIGPFRL